MYEAFGIREAIELCIRTKSDVKCGDVVLKYDDLVAIIYRVIIER
jgi:hypothetical protein